MQEADNDLVKKIINFLLYISKNIETIKLDEINKACLFKVFEYLKDYKMDNPIQFLKVYIVIFIVIFILIEN